MELDLISRLNSKNLKLSKSQKVLADYIVEHCDKAAFLTANKLGEAVEVSESTVVRFAVRLGYEGYPELQKAVQELIRNRLTAVQRLEVTADLLNKGDLLHSVMHDDSDRIAETFAGIDREVFDKVVASAINARRIYIIGLRSSTALAEFLYYYFNLMFNDVRLLTTASSGALPEQMHWAGENDMVIGISFPRYSRMTVEAMEYARERGAVVTAITDSQMSPLVRYSDFALCAKSDTASFVDSLVAPMSLLNALVIAAGMHKRETLTKVFGELESIWDEYSIYRLDEEL